MLLAIDPGLRGCGVALFQGKTLQKAYYAKSTESKVRGARAWAAMVRAVVEGTPAHEVDSLIIEYPQIYSGGDRHKVDPMDLIELQGVVGGLVWAYASAGIKVQSVLPRDWKGQVPKKIHNKRVEKKLTTLEGLAIKRVGSLTHNILDAIGIGFWRVGR